MNLTYRNLKVGEFYHITQYYNDTLYEIVFIHYERYGNDSNKIKTYAYISTFDKSYGDGLLYIPNRGCRLATGDEIN